MFQCSKCSFRAATWKPLAIHMSRKHGGYSAKEKLEISRAASARVQSGAGGADFAASPPASETPSGEVGPSPGGALPLRDRFAALKGKFAKGLAVLSWEPLAQALKLEPLEEEDRKTLAEGWAAALDCLDIQPQFSTHSVELRSWLWAFAFPLLALILVVAERFDYRTLWSFVDGGAKAESDRGDHRAEGDGKNDPGDPPGAQSQADGDF